MSALGGIRDWKLPAVALATLLGAGVVTLVLLVGQRAEVEGATPQQRVEAVHRIAARRPNGSDEVLARAAGADSSPMVRRAAIAALSGAIKADHRPVIERGTRDADRRVRAVAADTLGLFGDGASANVLIELIRSDPDVEVRMAALRGLSKCDGPLSTVVLLQTAEKADNRNVRLQAMKALFWKIKGNIRAMRNPDDGRMWRDLIQRLKRDHRIRQAYTATGTPLDFRPQDIVGTDFHPERHEDHKH
jgi:hypothetical protein